MFGRPPRVGMAAIPYVRARSAHPIYYSAFPPLAQGLSQLFWALPKALPSLIISYLCGQCMLSVPNFRVQSRLAIIYRLAQNLFPALK